MQCVEILKQVGDWWARILYNMSHSFLSLGKYDEAIDYLNRSLALTDDDAARSRQEQQLAGRHAMISRAQRRMIVSWTSERKYHVVVTQVELNQFVYSVPTRIAPCFSLRHFRSLG